MPMQRNQIVTEHGEQRAVFDWVKLMETRYPLLQTLHAIPNGAAFARRGNGGFSLQAMKMKEEGLRPGMPDLALPVPRPPYASLFIEMKVQEGRVRKGQVEMHGLLRQAGNRVEVCWSADEAIETIKKYLGLEDG